MDLKLRGKRALVTGSTAGIGFAIAQGLARERAEVIVNGRTEQKVAEAVQRISSEVGSRAIGIAADLSSAEGVARLGAQAGRVDILVNNVGIFWPVPFLEISDQDWFHIFEVNVMSGVGSRARFCHQCLTAIGAASFLSPVSPGCKSHPRWFITV